MIRLKIPSSNVRSGLVGLTLLLGRTTRQVKQDPRVALFVQAITLAANIDGGRGVQEAVEDGGGQDGIREDRAPVAIGFVGRENDAALQIAARDELEEKLSGALIEGEVAHFVEDQDLGAAQGLQAGLQTVGFGILRQLVEQISHRIEHDGLPIEQGGHPQTDRQVGFAHAGRTEQQHVLAVGHKA